MLAIEYKACSALPETIPDLGEHLVIMPFIDPDLAKRSAQQLARRAGIEGGIYAVYDDKRIGFVSVINAVFRRSTAPMVAYVAQDAFGGRDWLKRASVALNRDDGGLVGFNDGKWFGTMASFGLARRSWAETNYDGDFFLPAYKRHYADAELTIVAMQQRRYRYDPNAVLFEVDWDKESQPVDREDRVLFNLRRRQRYDGKVFDSDLLRVFS